MYVNISHCDLICPDCGHSNFSRETAKQLLMQLKTVEFKEEEIKRLEFYIICDQCKKKFYIRLSVLKHRLVYLIE